MQGTDGGASSLLQGPGRLRDRLHLRGLSVGPGGRTASSPCRYLPSGIRQAGEELGVSALVFFTLEQLVRKDAPLSAVTSTGAQVTRQGPCAQQP